mgnify:CR=1 FL=1
MNTLIAYFSYTGHTKGIAQQIQDLTGGTLFEIRPLDEIGRASCRERV